MVVSPQNDCNNSFKPALKLGYTLVAVDHEHRRAGLLYLLDAAKLARCGFATRTLGLDGEAEAVDEAEVIERLPAEAARHRHVVIQIVRLLVLCKTHYLYYYMPVPGGTGM